MREMTTRDPHAMDKFADQVDSYINNIEKACNALENDLTRSREYLKDEIARRAIEKLRKLCEELQSGLPTLKDASNQLSAAAKPLYKAPGLF